MHDLYFWPCYLGHILPHSVNFDQQFIRLLAGSLIGGIKETQDCIDLCFKHGIYPDCTVSKNMISHLFQFDGKVITGYERSGRVS